jgi:Zn-dependent protease
MIKVLLVLLSGAKFGKILLTAGTMALSLLVYTSVWGWPFALGFVLLIFAHEMGHFLAAQQRGLRVGVPVFIPFVGAWIQLKEQPMSVETEAYVAFAGPFIGTLAAFGVYFYGRQIDSSLLLAIAYSGFFLNLINLLPVHPLDGGRITAILSPRIWLIGLPMLAALFFYQPSPMLLVIGLMALPHALRAWRYVPDTAYYAVDVGTKVEYAVMYLGLVALLGLMTFQMHRELAGIRGGAQ